MDIVKSLIYALLQQDYVTLSNPTMVWMIYFILFIILFLENGLLPSAFLPGDSLLILVGILISKGIMNFFVTLFVLTVAASLGCWMSYIQGRLLGNTAIIKKWMTYVPFQYNQKAQKLFYHYGLSALIIGRFIAFVRTLLPTIAGLSGLSNARFQLFNWMSAVIWVLILIVLGCLIGNTTIFHKYEDQLMFCLMLLPLLLLIFGLFSSLYFLWRKKISFRAEHKNL